MAVKIIIFGLRLEGQGLKLILHSIVQVINQLPVAGIFQT
jgi:hypothetical protein